MAEGFYPYTPASVGVFLFQIVYRIKEHFSNCVTRT